MTDSTKTGTQSGKTEAKYWVKPQQVDRKSANSRPVLTIVPLDDEWYFADTFKCSFEAPDVERAGSLGAFYQLIWIPEVDCIRFVPDLWGASGSVALNGKTNWENRSIIGIVNVEIGVDEF